MMRRPPPPAPRRQAPPPAQRCVEINQCVGCTDNSSLSHFSAMARPSWLGRAVRKRNRHAVEQASRRWRGGRRDDSARTRRKILISTQAQRRAASTAPAQQSGGMMSGLLGTMAQGFAFGTGSSIARGAVGAAGDALFGGSASEQAAQPAAQQAAAAPAAQDACAVDKRAFYQCLETSNGDADKCSVAACAKITVLSLSGE